MKRKINFLGFLSLVSTVALLGIVTEEKGWYGFLGFLYYLGYFWIIPDESFKEYVKNSSTLAFFIQVFSLIPTLTILGLLKYENYIQVAFGIAFCLGVFVFSISIALAEWRETQGILNDK